MLMVALESGYYYFIYLIYIRQILSFFNVNTLLLRKMNCISLKSCLWIFWGHLKSLESPFKENINIQVANWHFKSNGKYKWNYLTSLLHFRERPTPEEQGKMKAGEQTSSQPEIKEWRREFSWEGQSCFFLNKKKDKLAF